MRIQQLSGSTTSLVLPPARSKRSNRSQIHSTAFEDLEIATPTTPILATASSLDLTTIKGSDTKLNLTFEEFEKQFQFKEVNAKIPEPPKIDNPTTAIPVPPLRLNRSSSALIKPERNPAYNLKSSQSIAIPEFKKMKERRPADFSRSTEDLTKIDDLEENKLFETFEERKPLGNYKESDGDLQEQYEKELNESLKKLEFNVYDPFKSNVDWNNDQEMSALEALKHERIIYHTDINESPDVPTIGNWNFNLKTYQIERAGDVEFTEEEFKNGLHREFGNPQSSTTEPILQKSNVKEQKSIEIVKDPNVFEPVCLHEPYSIPVVKEDELVSEFRSVKERRPTKFVKDSAEDDLLRSESKEDPEIEFFKNSVDNKDLNSESVSNKSGITEMQENERVTEFRSVKDRRPTEFVKDILSEDLEERDGRTSKFEKYFSEEMLAQSETTTNHDEETFGEFRSVKERRPTEFVKESPEFSGEFKSIKEHRPTVKDSLNESPASSGELEFKSIKERRSTEFDKEKTHSIDETSQPAELILINPQLDVYVGNNEIDDWPQFEEELEMPKVNKRNFNPQDFIPQSSVEDVDDFNDTTSAEDKPTIFFNIPTNNKDNNEKFTLNQRRPTGYIRNRPESPDLSETEVWQQETCNNHSNYYSQIRSLMTTEYIQNSSAYSSTQREQREVSFTPQAITHSENKDDTDSPIKHRRPTGFVRKGQYTESYNEDTDNGNEKVKTKASNQRNNVEIVELQSTKFQYDDEEDEFEKLAPKQRRPTGFAPTENDNESWKDIDLHEHTRYQVRFEDSTHFNEEKDTWDPNIKQRRPTGYIKTLEITDVSNETEDYFKLNNQRMSTSFQQEISLNNEVSYDYELENKEIPLNPTVKFKQMEYKDENSNQDSLIKQRRPTGFARKQDNFEKQVNFKLDNEDENKDGNSYQENEAIKQRRPTGFIRKETNLTDDSEPEHFNRNKKRDLTFLENSPPIYSPAATEHSPDFDDKLWREMEKEVELFNAHNIEEQFTTIRHSYEINEADFLDQKSPINSPQQPLGFGKTIDDDWVNFEKLKTSTANKGLQSPEEFQVIYAKEEMATITTTSILKDTKAEEDMQFKPRKSKVTFDFKTEERLIPARNTDNDLRHNFDVDDDDDDDVYDKPPPPVPLTPQPMQRLSKINYNNETLLLPLVSTPSTILLFGSQVSQEDNAEDSWSAIRKHRNLTEEFQNSSTEFKTSSPPPLLNTPPPKPAYRNPMAQLAIQRAKEVRADMDGFKARSINNRKPATLERQRQNIVNLNYDDGTDA